MVQYTSAQVQNAEGAVKAAQSAYELAETNAKRYREALCTTSD